MTSTTKNIHLGSEPNYVSGRQVLSKGGLGAMVGLVIGFLMFIILYMVMGQIGGTIVNNVEGATAATSINPLLPLILIVIAFIATFIGNVMLAGIYNLFYSTKYYDLGKMFSTGLLSNVVVFFVFTPLYLVFYSSRDALFVILSMHIIFSIFASYTHTEILTNPNYSSSHLIGTTIGASICALLYLVAFKSLGGGQAANIVLLPAILGYTLIPFFHAIREKIYYQFYENGNDFLYLPTLQEINRQEEITHEDTTDNDITVDLG